MFDWLFRRGQLKLSLTLELFAVLFFAVSPAQSQWTITTVAGNGNLGFSGDGGPAIGAALNHPRGMTLDSAGNLYAADSDNYRVRRVAVNATISTVAGNGGYG